ncbi:heavy-metal-associated domain-containing protein [Geobacter benzoatilyticus]|uniref:Heavy-metal-associated domain-containing protein n=2 Tax=Geobacter benzoatilyticus TaxID=2815309 RepID=A0ABX7Q8J9_9BACT|nr:heavy-metal-associated domain-containing protein [Geobacter benzoatilyticus]
MLLILAAVVVVGILAFSVRLEASVNSVAVLRTQGMTCGSCALRIEDALKGAKGVSSVQVNVNDGQVVVGYDSSLVKPEAIAEQVTGSGYGSSIIQVLTPEEYASLTGKNIAAGIRKGGCGKGCCGTK